MNDKNLTRSCELECGTLMTDAEYMNGGGICSGCHATVDYDDEYYDIPLGVLE